MTSPKPNIKKLEFWDITLFRLTHA